MVANIELRTVESVPEDAHVSHYDELGDAAKAEVAALATTESATGAAESSLSDYDLVKFTDYYRVQRIS